MNTAMIDMMTCALGMKGISDYGSKNIGVEGEGSFNDFFSQAVTEATKSNISVSETPDVDVEVDFQEEEPVSFSELVKELSEKIGNADKDVIAACLQLMQSTGKAVSSMFGFSSSDDEASGDVESLLGMLISVIPEKNEENAETDTIVDGLEIVDKIEIDEKIDMDDAVEILDILQQISDVIKTGLADDEISVPDIVEGLKASFKQAQDDEEEISFENVVITMLCNFSGSANTDELVITKEGLSKAAEVIDVFSTDSTAEEMISMIKDVMKTSEEPVIKFSDFMSKDNVLGNLRQEYNTLKIVDASAQFGNVGQKENKQTNTEIPVDMAINQPMQGMPEVKVSDNVYKELSDVVTEQITEPIVTKLFDTSDNALVKELTIVLNPENLGEIAVKLISEGNGTVSVVLAAQNPEIGKAMSQNASILAESLSKQNVEVSTVNVVNPSEAGHYMGLDFTNQGFNRRNDNDGNNSQGSRNDGINAIDGVGSDMVSTDELRAQKLLKEAKLWATA